MERTALRILTRFDGTLRCPCLHRSFVSQDAPPALPQMTYTVHRQQLGRQPQWQRQRRHLSMHHSACRPTCSPTFSHHQHHQHQHHDHNRQRQAALPQRRSYTDAASPPRPHTLEASTMSMDEYHERSDAYLESLLAALEELSEETGEIDVDYSAGVLNVEVPEKGTYVLNKQPPNKQIWLSSPITGPKRYDWVAPDAEGTGDWVYLRDGTSLTALLKEELDVEMNPAALKA